MSISEHLSADNPVISYTPGLADLAQLLEQGGWSCIIKQWLRFKTIET
jgi:hypothetical protein